MPSTVGRVVVAVQTNKSGGSVAYGDVVITDAANDSSFTTTTSGGLTSALVGVCIEPNGIASNSSGRIQFQGVCPQVNANASVTRGNFVKTHTVAKQATGSASRTNGTFGVALTTSSTPIVLLFGLPDIAASGNVAGDAIWDAAGDLAVGSGADTAARLAIGNAGAVLARINGAVAWNANTSFPTATTGDRFFRTDRGLEYYYDGTRWLTTTLFAETAFRLGGASHTISATTASGWTWTSPYPGTFDLWVETAEVTFLVVSGGSALSGSHKWVGTWVRNNAGTTWATFNIDSGASNSYRTVSVSVGALLGTGQYYFDVNWTKTGSPGNLSTPTPRVFYRLVG